MYVAHCFCCEITVLISSQWETGQRATFNGQEVSFACGLSWENVQKSMYFNLNPHCLDRMHQWLREHDAHNEQGGSSNGDMPPPSGSQHPSSATGDVLSPGHPPVMLEGSKNVPNPQRRRHCFFILLLCAEFMSESSSPRNHQFPFAAQTLTQISSQ